MYVNNYLGFCYYSLKIIVPTKASAPRVNVTTDPPTATSDPVITPVHSISLARF